MENQKLTEMIIKQLDRMESNIVALVEKLDETYQHLNMKIDQHIQDDTRELQALRMKHEEHNQTIKIIKWIATTGVFSLFGTAAAIIGVYIAWKH